MDTITERQRQRLRQWADEHMDEETADIFMASTPPTGWGDVATKQDLATLGELLTARFDAKLAEAIGGVQKQITAVHQELARGRRSDTWQSIGILVAILLAMLGNTIRPRWSPPPPPSPPQVITPNGGGG